MNRVLVKDKIKDLSVLFIDDEKVVIDIMKEILPMLFKEAYYALDGVEGINQFKMNEPDIIITDLSMPKLDGIEMIKEIKILNENIKVICISGHNEHSEIDKCLALGCTYIVKPISSTVLFKAFEEVLDIAE